MRETKNLRMYTGYSVISKHFQGFTNRAIAEMECLDAHTVGVYIKNYKINGLERLVMNTSPGCPRILNKKQEEQLVQLITTKTLDEVGFKGRKNWTIELIKGWTNNKFNVDIKHSSMAVILHRLNLSYTRPTYVLKKADKNRQDTFIENFKELKKLLNGDVDHVMFEDESMIRDYQAIQKTLFMKGCQRKIPIYVKNAGVKLIGVLNYETGQVYCEEHEKYDAKVFFEFLKKVVNEG